MTSREPQDATSAILRRYAPMIYGPTALYSIGNGSVIPLIPAIARDLGASIPLAALVAAAMVVGQLCGNLPAGWLVSRVGERRAMLTASLASLIGMAGILFAPSVIVLGIAMFLVGLCSATFAVARHTFMTLHVPYSHRARALSLVGGSFRLGSFAGPFVAALLIGIFHSERASVWFFGGMMLIVAALVAFGPDPERAIVEPRRQSMPGRADGRVEALGDTGEAVTGPVTVPSARSGVFATIWRYRGLLARLGTTAASLSSVRAARTAMVPLWGLSIGLDSQNVALIVGIAGAVEFSLFYASGQIMDRFGRLWASVPSLMLMGSGFIGLAFTHGNANAAMWLGIFAIVIAVGNGLSSGILLTLGADVAPKDDPAPFLGAWRTLTDGGGAAMPLAISGITALLSLPFAAGFVGVVGLVGAGLFLRYVPRYTSS
ncbi:MAG: MFS transporter [Microbacterium sp.]